MMFPCIRPYVYVRFRCDHWKHGNTRTEAASQRKQHGYTRTHTVYDCAAIQSATPVSLGAEAVKKAP